MLGHYLMFDGDCSEALDLYVQAFDATLEEKMTYGDMPPNPDFPIRDEDRGLVLNSRLGIDGQEIMCADSSRGAAPGENMYVSFTTTDKERALKAWGMLAQGGAVYMDLAPSFFAELHGSLRDRYGVNWMFTVMR